MIEDLVNISYDICKSILIHLDNEDLEILSYVSSTFYQIMKTPIWEERVKLSRLNRHIQNCLRNMVHTPYYTRRHELFECSYIGNVPKVYIDTFFAGPNDRELSRMAKDCVAANLKKDIRPFLGMAATEEDDGKKDVLFFIRDMDTIIDLSYQDIMAPLIDFSDKCLLLYDTTGFEEKDKITMYDSPTLEFTFTYDNYMKVLDFVMIRQCSDINKKIDTYPDIDIVDSDIETKTDSGDDWMDEWLGSDADSRTDVDD